MTKLRVSSLILLLVPWLFTAVVAQDYSELVFSGFVELAPTATTDEAVDFSKVEIQLFTEDNKFVDRTHCSSNGFFLIPIYDKKSYILKVKPPVESIFEPESIPVNLKGLSNEEVTKITETSFSFKFVGFSLTDHVRIEGSSTGAVGVKVGLFDSKKNKVAETYTSEGGNFRFDRVITGKYSIQLESKDEGFYWREGEGSIQCELGWKKGQECSGKLVISSFEVKGVTVNQNNILNKHIIFLYNEDKAVASKSTLAPIKDHPLASASHNYISYSLIDKDGNFKFTHIPKGRYFLKIYTSDRTNKIEIEPDVYHFEVQDGPVEINNPFSINRFAIKGRVVDNNGKGINGIRITLDGEIKAHSDAQGYYYIEKVQVGTYTLEGQHEHLFFKPIANLHLEPTMSTLPELVLSSVDLCGEVSLKDGSSDTVDSEFANARFTVYLGGPGGEKRSTIVDQNGKYCFEVQPGRYTIYPVVSNVGARSESLLSPKSREVEVSNEPILDVSFYRHRLSVSGQVNFLKNAKPAQIEKTKITLSSTGKGAQKTVSLGKDGTFHFDQILPGSYRVDIENDNFCWSSDSQRVDLQSSNVTNIAFEQTGFAFKYHTTRALEVRITPPGGKPIDTQLLPSSNSYCVEQAGTYKITPDICYQFAQSDFSVSTDDTTGVVLDPIGYLVRGDVIINETIIPNTNASELSSFIVENIHASFQVESSNGATSNKLFKLRFIKREDEGYLRFQYTNYVEPNSNVVVELKLKAKATAEATEILKNFMFNPTQVKLHVSETCISDSKDTRIEIRKGKIYTGTVQPQLTDWTLTVSYVEAPEGVNAVVHTQHMNSPSFKLGPFPDFYQYEITAEKEGYKFDPTIKEEGYNQFRVVFTAHKLSHLRIQVLDEERRPVPGALLFVSSMSKQNFLKLNNYTNEKGAFNTHSLVKGDYLVRPVLKEYSFTPVQTTITIEDGEHKELTIIAKRVAYSAFGRVHKLNKAGCAGLKIQAVPQGDSVPTETTETDEEGNYRLKGLVPGNIYAISVEKSSQYSTIKPERLLIEAKDYDLKNIEFLGFDKKQTHTIAGSVQFDSTYTEDDVDQVEEVQLRLFRQGQEEPVDTKTVKFFRYFEFKDLQPADYTIKAIVKKTKSLPFEYTQDVSSHQFGESAQVPVAITVSKERARIADSTPQGSVLAPVLILIVIFLLLNIDTLSAKYKKYKENQASSVNKKRS